MYSKPAIFVVISVLAVALIYSSFTFDAFAETVFSETSCTSEGLDGSYTCCYQTYDDRTGATISTYCKECQVSNPGYGTSATCTDYKKEALEKLPTPPPSGPSVVPGEGTLSQDGGVLQQPSTTAPPQIGEIIPQIVPPTSADEGSELPTIAGEEPLPCPEGQVLDEETGLCVLEVPEVAGEPEAEEPPADEEQPSAEEDIQEPPAAGGGRQGND